jgi:hypothetical protein
VATGCCELNPVEDHLHPPKYAAPGAERSIWCFGGLNEMRPSLGTDRLQAGVPCPAAPVHSGGAFQSDCGRDWESTYGLGRKCNSVPTKWPYLRGPLRRGFG